MPNRQELNARIKAKLQELEDDAEERERGRERLQSSDLQVDEIRDELQKAKRRLRRRAAALEDLRADLEQLNAGTPDEDTPEEQELSARLDHLAGEYEEAVTARDQLLDRLDQLKDEKAEAKAALEAAVAESDEDRKALERMRARRQRIRERREANDRPSEHFDWAEFDCNDGTPLPEAAKPAVKDWCKRIGEPLRAKFGPVRINSAYRTSAYNATIVGSAPNSIHIYDLGDRACKAVAVDVACAKGTASEWYDFTAGLADGRGKYQTFHHADTRSRIGEAPATWDET